MPLARGWTCKRRLAWAGNGASVRRSDPPAPLDDSPGLGTIPTRSAARQRPSAPRRNLSGSTMLIAGSPYSIGGSPIAIGRRQWPSVMLRSPLATRQFPSAAHQWPSATLKNPWASGNGRSDDAKLFRRVSNLHGHGPNSHGRASMAFSEAAKRCGDAPKRGASRPWTLPRRQCVSGSRQTRCRSLQRTSGKGE